MYIWCPKNNTVTARKGLGDKSTVDLVIFDGRSLTDRVKAECSPDQLKATILEQLISVYPSVLFNVLDDEYYYKKPESGNKLIKIGISAYHAGFGTDISAGIGTMGGKLSTMVMPSGKWNAATGYYVEVVGLDKPTEKEIFNIASRPNTWGYKTAKTALNETYNKSNQELFFFLDKQLQ